MGCDLAGRGILVTRAAHQAMGLIERIESHRGRAVVFPAIEIAPGPDPEGALTLLRQRWDLVVFISPNAVRHAAELLSPQPLCSPQVAAVGSATAQALAGVGWTPNLVPPARYDSEGLLMLPALQQMQGRRVLIVRGVGGRPLLGDTLRARGAEVGYAEVYRRLRPAADPTPLLARWRVEVDLVTATSAELLDNLVAMLGESGWPLLRETPLLVISERMAQRANALGFTQVVGAPGADDESVLDALCDWCSKSAR